MSAPVRVVRTARATYALDPYVRDQRGRFADHPTQPLEPIAQLVDLTNGNGGAWSTGPDPSCSFRVRTVREEGGGYRVIYLED